MILLQAKLKSGVVIRQVREFLRERRQAILLLLFPLLAFNAYFLITNRLPESDGAGYMLFGSWIHQRFQLGGLSDGFSAVYNLRDWRPTIFHLISVPFFFMLGSDLQSVLAFTNVAILAVLLVYSYLFLRLFVDRSSAAMGAACVGCVPVYWNLARDFFSETLMPGLVLACVYHLAKFNLFRERRHLFALTSLLALTIGVRPEQAVLAIGPAIAVASLGAVRARELRLRSLVLGLTVAVAAVMTLLLGILASPAVKISLPSSGDEAVSLLRQLARSGSLTLAVAFTLLGTSTIWRARHNGSNGFVGFCTLASGLVLLWYWPFGAQLFEWIYRTTLGDGAAGMIQRTDPASAKLDYLINGVGGSYLLWVVAIGAALKIWPWRQDRIRPGLLRLPLIYLGLSAALPLLLMLCWNNPQTALGNVIERRLTMCYSGFILVCLAFALADTDRPRWARVTFRGLLGVQIVALAVMPLTGILPKPARMFVANLNPPQRLVPEPNHFLIDYISKEYAKAPFEAIEIEGYTDLNPGTLTLLSQVSKAPYRVEYDSLRSYSGPSQISRLAALYPIVIISAALPPGRTLDSLIEVYAKSPDPNTRRLGDLYRAAQSHDMSATGLKVVDDFVLVTSRVFVMRRAG